MLRRSRDNYNPYSPRRAVVSNLNHGTIGICLGGVSLVLYIHQSPIKVALVTVDFSV